MMAIRVILGIKDRSIRNGIRNMLSRAGYLIIAEAEDGQKILQLAQTVYPEVVILDYDLPVVSGLEAAKILEQNRVAPVVVIGSKKNQDLLHRAIKSGIYSYVMGPVDETIIFPAIECALINYQRAAKMEKEIAQLKESLETRKLLEKAKGIIMETQGITEKEAFRRIQKQSMDRRTSMLAIAKAIILSHDLQTKA
ncbi:MAG: ANTAR domain-containing protein [Clostridia bacterium]|nr:ANTAR domain-containing protein [Clostridia bacterium]